MTDVVVRALHPRPAGAGRGLLLASRGDALTPYLFDVLARRYPVSGRIEPELSPLQRLSVAAGTFRPTRTRWAEQFYKSHLGYRFRSANAVRQRGRLGRDHDPVFQVHALFELPGAPSLLYVDCTHEQAARQWPAWNPLHGRSLAHWYDREQAAYAQAVHLFAFSHRTRDSLVGAYGIPADRVSVVGAGVNLDPLPAAGFAPIPGAFVVPDPVVVPDSRVGHDAGPDRPTVLFVGNDFARKGGPTLLAAFRRVRRELPGARLQLVGTNPGIAAEPGVEVLGRIHDRARVAALYRQASAFCLPSVFDPLPLVLLEAMAHGLPCVATDTAGIPDVVTDGRDGLLVPAGDDAAVARALLGVLTDPALAARLGGAARDRVVADFTWDRVVDRMAPVLDRVLAP